MAGVQAVESGGSGGVQHGSGLQDVGLTAGWHPPHCVAEELALKILLDQAELCLEQADLEIPDWREIVEEYVFADADHELLYDPAFDGIEDDQEFATGTAPMAFSRWFTPFSKERPVSPYLLDARGPALQEE